MTFTRETLQSFTKHHRGKVETSLRVTMKTIKPTLSKFLIRKVEKRIVWRYLVRKSLGKRKFVGLRLKRYIVVCLKRREREVVNWTDLGEDGRHRWAVVCKMINMRIP